MSLKSKKKHISHSIQEIFENVKLGVFISCDGLFTAIYLLEF